jgi:hypothetical protein
MATKRRTDYFEQAETLARKTGSRTVLEDKMKKEARVLVLGLRDGQMRWEEYERTLLDKTLVTALAAVFLGAGENNPRGKMEKAWPKVVGDQVPPLTSFLGETKKDLDSGILRIGDKTQEFAEGHTWPSLVTRVIRYIANPSYGFFSLGQYETVQEQGYKEMRRVAHDDKRTCPDCFRFDEMGWQPLGSVPLPGQDCRCYDYCRCYMEYR